MSETSSASKKDEEAVSIVDPSEPETPVDDPFPVIDFLPLGILINLFPSAIDKFAKGLEESESTKVELLAVKVAFLILIG